MKNQYCTVSVYGCQGGVTILLYKMPSFDAASLCPIARQVEFHRIVIRHSHKRAPTACEERVDSPRPEDALDLSAAACAEKHIV